jgi:hypothetical protein
MAAETISNSCPKDAALTASSRLAAMQQRVEAMRIAVSIVKPALDRIYGLLGDEQQKAAFDAIGPERNGATTALAADRDESPRRHHGGHRHGYSVGGRIFRMMGL